MTGASAPGGRSFRRPTHTSSAPPGPPQSSHEPHSASAGGGPQPRPAHPTGRTDPRSPPHAPRQMRAPHRQPRRAKIFWGLPVLPEQGGPLRIVPPYEKRPNRAPAKSRHSSLPLSHKPTPHFGFASHQALSTKCQVLGLGARCWVLSASGVLGLQYTLAPLACQYLLAPLLRRSARLKPCSHCVPSGLPLRCASRKAVWIFTRFARL